jgi:hypothetical protein
MPRFSTGTPSAAAQTVWSCESVKATMRPWSCRRDGCQPRYPPAPCYSLPGRSEAGHGLATSSSSVCRRK